MKNNSIPNSAEHEIRMLIGIKTIKKLSNFQAHQQFSGSDKPRMLFFMLINIKLPTIVGILSFMSRKIFMLS